MEDNVIYQSLSAKYLDVYIDHELSFEVQITAMCEACYMQRRAIRIMRKLIDEAAAKTLAQALVLSKID